MSDLSERIHQLSPKRLALVALELEERLEAAERAQKDPIAIVGLACRFPGGAVDPDSFWQLLQGGVDAIREVPGDRWDVAALYDPDPDKPGTMATKWGGFLSDCDRFDADFFGISPREAQSMDPQQRLLLEVTWEALESAGIAADRVHGSATGVFVGLCNNDYSQILLRRGADAIDAYLASGNAYSVASGRISYLLGLQGPSLSVDTACSSSLVAVHLACQSLRNNECRMALAAGVNLILAPETTITLSKAHMMAPDGRCKTFDASANGFVRGEGCGVVALKRLSDAQADGDRILAVIRGSALSQDGRSSGLTAPNGPSQEGVIRAALAMGSIEPGEVDYVEAHGTGTSLGDPIEVRALGGSLCSGRTPDRPLLVGSVKTNIGHLESAAGIAGLIKTVLALEHEQIPPHLHFRSPNPHIPWESFPLRITTEATPWKRGARRRIAGVSSFGFSGTNAHIVLEEAPLVEPVPNTVERSAHVLTVSARSEAGLLEQAVRASAHLRRTSDSFADVCWTANTGRAHGSHRLALTAASAGQAADALDAFVAGQPGPGLTRGEAGPEAQDVVFLFTGQGAQYVGMSRRLYETEPVFKRAFDHCADLFTKELPSPLLPVIFGAGPDDRRIDETAYTQPALFAVEYALSELWRSWGVRPSVVMGHSVGEFAAACVAGIMSLEDGVRLIAARGRLMQQLPDGGRMAAILAPLPIVEQAVADAGTAVSIASINGPDNIVISGVGERIDGICASLTATGIRCQPLTVSHAFHSPLMQPMLDEFERVARTVSFSPPRIGFVSNLTGRMMSATETPDAGYWRRHVLAPVQFADSVKATFDAGHRIFVEIGPHPTLLGMARRVVDAENAVWLPSLRKNTDDVAQMFDAAARLHVRGATVDWSGFDREYRRRRVELPTYAFQRTRYWAADTPQRTPPAAAPSGPEVNALLGRRLSGPMPTFEARLDPRRQTVLQDHRVGDQLVVPGPVYLEMVSAAACAVFGADSIAIDDLRIREPLVLTEHGTRRVQTVVTDEGDRATVRVFGTEDDERWVCHASATARRTSDGERSSAPANLDEIRARCATTIAGADFYARVHADGIHVGGALQPIERVWSLDGEALASLVFPDAIVGDPSFRLHPAILDAAMLAIGAAGGSGREAKAEGKLHVLSRIDRVRVHKPATARLFSHVVIETGETGGIVAAIRLCDANGGVVATLDGIRISEVDASVLGRSAQADDLVYDLAWRAAGSIELPVPAGAFIPTLEALGAALEPRSAALEREHGLAAFTPFLAALDRACAAYIARALSTLGFEFVQGRRGELMPIADRLGVLPRHRRLFRTLMQTLADDGVIALDGDRWEVVATPAAADPDAICACLVDEHPAFAGQARIAAACGRELAGVLRGDVDPLHLLFPNGSFELTEQLYQHGPFAQAYNALVRETVSTVVAALPEGRTLRCLEIGAGTGGTSAFVLPALPANRTRYRYTDVSKLFLTRASEKFKQYPFVQFDLLDIERDPLTQGFEAHSFDVILASNAIHATADLQEALRHVRTLLAPGGLLVLLEGTEHQRWVDLTFGLLEGWWKFTDHALRGNYPLLSQAAWRQLLERSGFSAAETIPRRTAAQAVIVARNPEGHPPTTRVEFTKRTWLVVGGRADLNQAVVALLEAGGARARTFADTESSYRAIGDLLASAAGDVEIVHLANTESSPGSSTGQELTRRLSGVARLVRAVSDAGRSAATKVWLVTSGAQAAASDEVPDRWQAPAWGLGRVIALEHPDTWGGLIDLDPHDDGRTQAATLVEAIVSSDVEDQVAIRRAVRYAPRIVRSQLDAAGAFSLRGDGSYLITGGTGGIAVQLVAWAAERGARHLVLTSRRGLPERSAWPTIASDDPASRLIAAILDAESRGVTVEIVVCDVASRPAMTALIASFEGARPRLVGVFHAAIAMSSAAVRDLDETAFASMLSTKVDGTCLLEELTRPLDLDFLVLFSSTTALLGVAGLGHYAAANLFLDASARSRTGDGRQVLSVNWGTWEEMRLASEDDRRSFSQAGQQPMRSKDALDRLERLLAAGASNKIVAAIDWAALKPVYEARRVRPLLAEVGALPSASRATAAAARQDGSTGLVDRLRGTAPAQRRDQLVSYVREQVAAVLSLPASEPIPIGRGLFEMGMDSLMSVELKTRLENGVGLPLPSTLTFNYPNIGALAGLLLRELDLDGETAAAAAPVPAAESAPLPAIDDEAMDDMSEDELASRLAERLGQIR